MSRAHARGRGEREALLLNLEMAADRYPLYAPDLLVLQVTHDQLTAHETPLTLLKGQYRKLAVRLHPDKNPAESEKAKELFQELHNSYQRLREHVMLNLDVNKISGEEASLYQYLSLHNVIKLNNGSMTVNIENSRPISGKKL